MSLFPSPIHPFFCCMETYSERGRQVLQHKILLHEAHKESKNQRNQSVAYIFKRKTGKWKMSFKDSTPITQVIFKDKSSFLTEFKGEIMNIKSVESITSRPAAVIQFAGLSWLQFKFKLNKMLYLGVRNMPWNCNADNKENCCFWGKKQLKNCIRKKCEEQWRAPSISN